MISPPTWASTDTVADACTLPMARTCTGTSRAVTCATATATPGGTPLGLGPGGLAPRARRERRRARAAAIPSEEPAPSTAPRRARPRRRPSARLRGRPQGSREPAQEIRALLAELGVGRVEPGEQSRDLREGDREGRERHHRQERLSGIQILGDEALRLAPAHLVDAPARGPIALGLAAHRARARLERLPLHEPHPVGVAARDVEPVREPLGGIVRRRRGPGHALAQLAPEDLAEEAVLVAEVVVEHPLVDAGPPRDARHAGAREALGGELLERGGEDAPAGALGVPPRRQSGSAGRGAVGVVSIVTV